jgi:hypothetical protein
MTPHFTALKQALLIALFMTLNSLHAAPEPPSDWMAWAQWVDRQHSVADDAGHGPDIGSEEWARALAWQLKISDEQGHGPDFKTAEWKAAVENKLMKGGAATGNNKAPRVKRERLSTHDTEARFLGIENHRCLGMTALCPDRCGHSGKLARFKIIKYHDYKKPGEYGDPKQEEFIILIEDNLENPKVPADTMNSIKALKPGAKVRLKWNHDYVTKDGSSAPERTITGIESLKPE